MPGERPRGDAPVPKDGPFRFLAYNIHHAQGVGGLVSVARIARVIASAAPDVVAISEAYRWRGRFDQPASIADSLGMRSVFQTNVVKGPTEYGNAIIAPEEPRFVADVRLSKRLEARGCLVAELEVRGARIRVAATHLSLHRRTRAAQIEELARDLPTDLPLVLMGDLNCGCEDLAPLRAILTVPDDVPPTFPSVHPVWQVDHVLFSAHWRLVGLGTVRSLASDHLPLYADLELR
jgi:endonuclease/exonuclease/phosphatase family metal-dependent hydrolase